MKIDGGQAFPVAASNGNKHESGMSLLDWFAGQALAGTATLALNKAQIDLAVANAYYIAALMLVERER